MPEGLAGVLGADRNGTCRRQAERVTCSWREALAGRGGGEERGEATARPVPSPAISSWYHCSKSTAGSSSFSIWRGRGQARRKRKGQDEEGSEGREEEEGEEGKVKGRPQEGRLEGGRGGREKESIKRRKRKTVRQLGRLC